MTFGWASDDPILLRTYIARYRVVFRVRLISVTALGLAVALSFSPMIALGFVAVQYLLFGLFIWTVEHANRRWDHPATPRQLRLQSLLLGFLIACHGNWLALYVNAAAPGLHVESVLLVITLFLLAGLQVHLSVPSLLLNVAPSFVSLFLITRPEQAGDLAPHLWAGGLFCFAILAASWRQQSTDHQSGLAAAALARRNEELQAALVVAEAASRAKTEFLAVTSHEVRTPLNAVLTMAGVLAREVRNRRHAHLARTIESAGGMLLQLLNGILDFTRAEAGKATLNLTAFDIESLIARLEAVWLPRCQQAGLTLRCEIEAPADCGRVQADAGRIEQTLVNLISNAEKFSPPGAEILVRCHATSAAPDHVGLRFEVLDRGPGVAPQDQVRIFEAFEQTDSGRDKGGAGLGLAICRSNVALMGGAFGRDDRPGGGSKFWLELDAVRADGADPMADDAPPSLVVARRLRVLAADDHPTNREVLRLLLEPFDIDLDLVDDGAQAAAAAGGAYDLILMDAKMPVMDGAEATRRIRAAELGRARRTPIIMVTANIFPDDVERYVTAGADEVLGKPIDVRKLLETIERFAAEPQSTEEQLQPPAAGAA
jgi:signal transduction histidine kinase/AmiR/NasT family two-component response regulator